MKLVLSLFLLVGLALSQVRLGSGEVLEVPCTANGQFLYPLIKLMELTYIQNMPIALSMDHHKAYVHSKTLPRNLMLLALPILIKVFI